MNVQNNPTITLTKAEIELAIKEYIDKNIAEKVYTSGTTVKFNLVDIGDDDGMQAYSPVYDIRSAKVFLEFQA